MKEYDQLSGFRSQEQELYFFNSKAFNDVDSHKGISCWFQRDVLQLQNKQRNLQLTPRGAGIDDLGMVLHDQLDQPLLAELTQASLGQRSTNLQPFRHNRWGDFQAGTSLESLSHVALSNRTWLLSLSQTFPLDPFFFLAFPPNPPFFFFRVFCSCFADPLVSFFGGILKNGLEKKILRRSWSLRLNNFITQLSQLLLNNVSVNFFKLGALVPFVFYRKLSNIHIILSLNIIFQFFLDNKNPSIMYFSRKKSIQ